MLRQSGELLVATTQIRRGCPVWSEVLLGALINLKALHELNHFFMFFCESFYRMARAVSKQDCCERDKRCSAHY